MKHWNNNLLCALDIETSGVISGYHEILQIAVIPLDGSFEWNPYRKFFDIYMKPDFPERVDYEAIKVMKREDTSLDYSKASFTQAEMDKFINVGVDQSKGQDMFMEWFEKQGLGPKKRVIPLGHNLQFDMSFIKEWLGQRSFDYVFDPRWRDTMGVSLFWNDCNDYRGERCAFKTARLDDICNTTKVKNDRSHNAFDDAIATGRAYGRMVKQFNLSCEIPEPIIPPEKVKPEKVTTKVNAPETKD